MKEILIRLQRKSPLFWKKAQWYSGSIITICGALLALENTYATRLISESLIWWVEHILFFATGLFTAAKLTIEGGYKSETDK